MIEEEEMEKQVNDGTFCTLSMNVPMSKMMMIYYYVLIIDHQMYDQYCILCNLNNNNIPEKMN